MTDLTAVKCRFCGDLAVARFDMDEGCFCYPDDRQQDLCAQHIIRATPLGSMEPVEVYAPVIFEVVWG